MIFVLFLIPHAFLIFSFYDKIRYNDKFRYNYKTKKLKGERIYLFKEKLFYESGYFFRGSNFDWFI